jgi:hypothetical protein
MSLLSAQLDGGMRWGLCASGVAELPAQAGAAE